MAKKYKIVSSFTYKGKDGKDKQEAWVRIGPGEEVPALTQDELNKLLYAEKIAEISEVTGETIVNKKLTNLNEIEVEKFLRKSPTAITAAISSGNLSIDTLGKMLIIAEREKMPNIVKNAIEEKLNLKVSA